MPIIPEFSPTAGTNADGFADCQVNETLMTAEMHTQERCAGVKIYRLDRSAGLNVIPATAGSTFYPFNEGASFTAGDSLAIGCSEPEGVQAILYNLDQAGVHNGTLKVYDSTNGVWAANELAVTDEGNAFRSAGWHYILLPDNANRQTWKPSNDPTLAVESVPYFLLELNGIQAGDTPPRITDIVLIRKVFRWESHTDDVNGDTATVPAEEKHYPWTGSTKAWGFSTPAAGMEVYMGLVQTNVITDVHESLHQNNIVGKSGTAIPGWSNATNDFTVGPASLSEPIQKLPIKWSMPSEWPITSQSFLMDDGTTQTIAAYWIQERTTGIASYGAHVNPRYRLRARQFGNANVTGQEMYVAGTYKGLTIKSMTHRNTTEIVGEVVNLSKGTSASFTIPANPVFPVNPPMADLVFAEGEMKGMRCVAGGKAMVMQYEDAIKEA